MASFSEGQDSTSNVTSRAEVTESTAEKKEVEISNPAESAESKNMDDPTTNLFVNRSPNICSPFSVHNSHRLVFGSSRSILKPSSLFTDANVPSPSVTFGSSINKSVKLKPSVLSNPFANNKCASNNSNSNCDDKTTLPTSERPDSTNEDSASSSSTSPGVVFVPLNNACSTSSTNISTLSSTTNSSASVGVSSSHSVSNSTNNVPSSTSAGSEFVFGQNIHERVSRNNDDTSEPVVQNGIASTGMLFSAAVKQDKNMPHELSNGNTKTLSAFAKEYEEAHSVKRKYEEVAVVTGEEDEQNVLQINCKLFAFNNTTLNWIEKGRGTLRVNDKETSEGRSSRLVMRLLGNLRVVLNTKIWGEMTVELASKKNVRLTAIDSDGQVRIYLVTANPKDAEQLYTVLNNRIQRKKLKSGIDTKEGTSKKANTQ